MNKKLSLILLIFLLVSLIGCNNSLDRGSSSTDNGKDLKLGCMALTEPMIGWLKTGLEEKGYNVKIVIFDGNHLPAVACMEGNIDGLILNYLPWLETFNKENNANLYMVKPHLYFGFSALFSSKYSTLDEIPTGAEVALSGDPTNLELGLLSLEDAGLITLGEEKIGSFYSLVDIIDNPRDINILETEVTQTARYYDDLDLVSLDSGTAAEAGIDTTTYIYPDKSIIEKIKNSSGSNDEVPLYIDPDFGLIIREGDKGLEWVEDAIEVYLSDEFRDNFNKHYEGAYILYNKN